MNLHLSLRAMVHSSSEVEVIRNGGLVARIDSEKVSHFSTSFPSRPSLMLVV